MQQLFAAAHLDQNVTRFSKSFMVKSSASFGSLVTSFPSQFATFNATAAFWSLPRSWSSLALRKLFTEGVWADCQAVLGLVVLPLLTLIN